MACSRSFSLLLLRACLAAAITGLAPAADLQVSNVTADHVSHSDALLHFDVANGPWGWLRIRWTAKPETCTTGRGGTVIATNYNGAGGWVQSQPHMSVIISGLTAGQQLSVCPELSRDHQHWTSGVAGLVQTLSLPQVHPGLPALPRVRVPDYPDTTGFTKWRVGETRTPDCATLYSCYKAAVAEQTKHGTVIEIKAGTTIIGRTWVDDSPSDVRTFPASAVNDASSTITFPNHGYHEGDGVIFGTRYSGLPGSPPTPDTCDGINYGVVYYTHVLNPQTFQLTCDKPFREKGIVMRFRSPAVGNTLEIAPYPRRLHPIVVRTSTPDEQLPPPGTRVSPAWRNKLATLQADAPGNMAPYSGNGFNNTNISTTVLSLGNADGNIHPLAANTWFVGLEIVTGDNSMVPSDDPEPWGPLVSLPISSSDILFDRCYIHGRGYPNRITTAIYWDGRNNGFLNSYFDGLDYWHAVRGCQTVGSRFVSEGTNAMIGGSGPGPYLFINNYVEGAGNLWHHDGGGAASRPQNDYYYIRNTFNVPAKYQYGAPGSDGHSYMNRQPLEWKGGRRILLEGNIFPHNHHHVAVATVLFTSVGIAGQAGYGIGDLTITNNTWQHVPAVMSVVSTQGGQFQTAPINRILVRNNLMEDINGAYSVHLDGLNACDAACNCRPWTGWVFQGFGDGEDRIVDHNTIIGLAGIAPVLFRLGTSATEGLRITDNVLDIPATSDFGASLEGGNSDAGGQDRCVGVQNGERLLACRSPGLNVSNNLLLSTGIAKRPLQELWPGNVAAANPKDFGAASETNNFGVDRRALEDAQGKVRLSGAVETTESTAAIRFRAPDNQACPVDYSANESNLIDGFERSSNHVTGHERVVTISGLKGKTEYHFRVDCAVEQPMGVFQTK